MIKVESKSVRSKLLTMGGLYMDSSELDCQRAYCTVFSLFTYSKLGTLSRLANTLAPSTRGDEEPLLDRANYWAIA